MAGRKASVRYYPSRGAYFTTYRGKTHRLAEGPDDAPAGPTFLAALDKFKQLMQAAEAGTAKDANTVRTVVGRYLEWLASRRKPRTLALRKLYLGGFCGFTDEGSPPFGDLRVGELGPHHVERYCDFMRKPRWNAHQKKHTRWTQGMVRSFIDALHATLNWAAGPRQRLISANPVKGVERPPARSRGAESLVSPETHRRALEAADPGFRQLLVVCENTGCRPGELFIAEARHFEPQMGALVFRGQAHLAEGEESHKTSGKDRDRVIVLTGEALGLVKRLAAERPEGRLFVTAKARGCKGGQAWTTDRSYRRMRRLRKKAALPKTFTLYSYRHQYATAWLKAGGSIDDLAALLGNTPQVIRRHYSHLCDDRTRLRNLAEAFRAKAALAAEAAAPASTALPV
ncbi:MAG TPA: tyrosine-type recombinase/integrase [Gemmataceae bacterium]|nr:tyrosine-type recombinase/integrase [Gemmataceae bacterium]